jgi:hypothetical protein
MTFNLVLLGYWFVFRIGSSLTVGLVARFTLGFALGVAILDLFLTFFCFI